MGLLKGTWSFSRYHILGNMPEHFNDFIDEGLKKYAFANSAGQTAEKNLGWTSLENILDTEFAYAKYRCGGYIIFSLRIDRRTVPPSLLKLKVMETEKKYLADSGKKRIYRNEREDIKEKVQSELLARALNVPSFHELCWFPERQSLIFGSHSPKVREDFEKYFKESFHLVLQPFVPWEPSPTGPVPTGETAATKPVFWGREFLTWLWFKSEERNGTVDIPDKGENEVIFIQRLVLASGDGEYAETVVCQGLHCDMKEGREALRQGKKIKEARIRLSEDTAKWEFTLKADSFQFQSLRLPATTDDDGEEIDREGQNMERIYLIEKVMEKMDSLFSLFLGLRLSPQWEKEELPRIEKWLSQ